MGGTLELWVVFVNFSLFPPPIAIFAVLMLFCISICDAKTQQQERKIEIKKSVDTNIDYRRDRNNVGVWKGCESEKLSGW